MCFHFGNTKLTNSIGGRVLFFSVGCAHTVVSAFRAGRARYCFVFARTFVQAVYNGMKKKFFFTLSRTAASRASTSESCQFVIGFIKQWDPTSQHLSLIEGRFADSSRDRPGAEHSELDSFVNQIIKIIIKFARMSEK